MRFQRIPLSQRRNSHPAARGSTRCSGVNQEKGGAKASLPSIVICIALLQIFDEKLFNPFQKLKFHQIWMEVEFVHLVFCYHSCPIMEIVELLLVLVHVLGKKSQTLLEIITDVYICCSEMIVLALLSER